MKPCAKNRQPLAALALGELDQAEARRLQSHLTDCPACQQHFAELQAVTGNLKSANPTPEVAATHAFHQQLMRRLQHNSPRSPWTSASDYLRHLTHGWRTVMPLLAAVVVALVIQNIWFPRRPPPRPAVGSAMPPTIVAVRLPPAVPQPTLSHYRQAANVSLDALDALLNMEAEKTSAAPAYTIANLARADLAD